MPRILILLEELLAELTTLIDEDDGTVFQIQHIEQVEELEELLEEERSNGD